MNHCCLQVEVKLKVTSDEWLARCEAAAPLMSRLPGLVWKLWLLNPEDASAGGLYLFRDAAAARAYAEGPVLEQLRRSDAVGALTVRLLPIVDALSHRTRGLTAPDAPIPPHEERHELVA